MKHILVTVEEFLQNGGQLSQGREILNEKGQQIGAFENISSDSDGMYTVRRASGVFMTDAAITFVQIEVNPIWK